VGSVRLTEELWAAIEDVYAEIRVHLFLTGLTDGSLPHEAFRFYAVQDAHYLREFAPPEHDILARLSRHSPERESRPLAAQAGMARYCAA